MSIDIALDKVNHDILIEGNELKLVEQSDQVEQHIAIRLKFFRGEWFLDASKGLPFYSDILIKNPNIPNIDNIIKTQIIDTPEVLELLSYDSQYDAVLREYSIQFEYRDIHGLQSIQLSIFN